MFRNRFRMLALRLRTIDNPPADNGGDGHEDDTSKEFSRALAKRAAEIEAKYHDYEELKAKAAKYDEAEEAAKSELERMREAKEKAEAERDRLKAEGERSRLVDSIAEETGLDRSVVAMLSGDEKQLREHAEKLSAMVKDKSRQEREDRRKRSLPPTNPPAGGGDERRSAKELLRDAYADGGDE